MPVFAMQFTGDPVHAGPTPLAEGFVIAVKFAAAIAQHHAALSYSMQATVRSDAVLQGHFLRAQE